MADQFANPNDPTYQRRLRLVQSLSLPTITHRQPTPLLGLEHEFYQVWEDIVLNLQVDNEIQYLFFDLAEALDNKNPWEDDIELIERAIINSKNWLNEAKVAFHSTIKPCFYRMASSREYLKHFPNVNWTEVRIKSESFERSILSKKITPELLDSMLVEYIQLDFQGIIQKAVTQFVVETNSDCGYSKGKTCRTLIFKIDYTGQLVHAYAIPDEGSYRDSKKIRSSLL